MKSKLNEKKGRDAHGVAGAQDVTGCREGFPSGRPPSYKKTAQKGGGNIKPKGGDRDLLSILLTPPVHPLLKKD